MLTYNLADIIAYSQDMQCMTDGDTYVCKEYGVTIRFFGSEEEGVTKAICGMVVYKGKWAQSLKERDV